MLGHKMEWKISNPQKDWKVPPFCNYNTITYYYNKDFGTPSAAMNIHLLWYSPPDHPQLLLAVSSPCKPWRPAGGQSEIWSVEAEKIPGYCASLDSKMPGWNSIPWREVLKFALSAKSVAVLVYSHDFKNNSHETAICRYPVSKLAFRRNTFSINL